MLKLLDKTIELIISFMMIIMSVVILAQIFCRAFLNISLSWSNELASFLFSWIIFLGAAVGFKRHAHFSVDFTRNFFSKRVCLILTYLGNILITIFFLILVKYGFDVVSTVRYQSSPALGISMSIMYAVVPIGSIIMLIYLWAYGSKGEGN